jgi:O-antigen biosynthesis protein
MSLVGRVMQRALPLGSARRAKTVRFARGLGVLGPPRASDYQYWVENVEPNLFPAPPASGPTFSIVVPVFDGTLERHFFELITSVLNQTYERWELLIADATSAPLQRRMISRLSGSDARIRLIDVPENLGISANTNAALEAVSGDFVCFADHDDTLSPHALAELVRAIGQHRTAELLYSDEDKLSDDGDHREDPHFKADWSPDLLLNVNYITHLTCIRAETLRRSGMLRPAFDGAQDYDLLLRVTARIPAAHIVHVPRVLYHWRKAATSTAAEFGVKASVLEAGVAAISEHLAATNRGGAAVEAIAGRPGFYRVRHPVPSGTWVSIVLTGIHDPSAAQARYERLIARESGHRIAEVLSDVELDVSGRPFTLITSPLRPDVTAEQVRGDVVFCLAAAASPQSDDWCDDLVGALMQPHIVAVAPRVVSPGRQIVDLGLALAGDSFVPLVNGLATADSAFGSFEWVRNVDALSGRVYAIRRADLARLGSEAGPKQFTEAARSSGRMCLVWSHTSFVITGPTMAATRFFNPQLDRVGGALAPGKGFDGSFAGDEGVMW